MKKLLSIALTIILVLSLTSCGNKEKPAEEDTTPSETERIWSQGDRPTSYSGY